MPLPIPEFDIAKAEENRRNGGHGQIAIEKMDNGYVKLSITILENGKVVTLMVTLTPERARYFVNEAIRVVGIDTELTLSESEAETVVAMVDELDGSADEDEYAVGERLFEVLSRRGRGDVKQIENDQ